MVFDRTEIVYRSSTFKTKEYHVHKLQKLQSHSNDIKMISKFTTPIRPIFLLICIWILGACRNSSDKTSDKTAESEDTLKDQVIISRATKGKNVFAQYCTTCHISPDQHAKDAFFFNHIFDRYPQPGESYFIKYVQDSQLLKQSGDPYAKSLDNIYNSSYEHCFMDSLTDQDFQNLNVFIKSTFY